MYKFSVPTSTIRSEIRNNERCVPPVPKFSTNNSELMNILNRRKQKMNTEETDIYIPTTLEYADVYAKFHEFSRKDIKEYQKIFNKYDVNKDGFLDLTKLTLMLEYLRIPLDRLSLKKMMAKVDENHNEKISFMQFLLIYRKIKSTITLENEFAHLTEVNVDEVGVNGATKFFEAKIQENLKREKLYNDILTEQKEIREKENANAQRHLNFKKLKAIFQTNEVDK